VDVSDPDVPGPDVIREDLGGTRARIIALLRRARLTANELAAKLGLTHNAVRGHLAALQRDGLVRESGRRHGGSRPAVVYELAPRTESLLSRAYVPFVAQLLRVLGERESREELHDIMREVGRGLAAEQPRLRGDLRQRTEAASVLLNELGALTEVEEQDAGLVIRGYGCLLSEAVRGRPEVCRALESLLAELIGSPVHQCCVHGERPRCCFEVLAQGARNAVRGSHAARREPSP
jgi:predicted ArsR family transcriptional regulator